MCVLSYTHLFCTVYEKMAERVRVKPLKAGMGFASINDREVRRTSFAAPIYF